MSSKNEMQKKSLFLKTFDLKLLTGATFHPAKPIRNGPNLAENKKIYDDVTETIKK